MIFHQRHADDAKGGLLISDRLCAIAHPCLNKSVFKELWQQFTFGTSVLTITECNDCIFTVGDAVPPPLDGYDYSIGIEPCGFGVHTTWHTLSSGMPFVLLCAQGGYNTEAPLTLLPAYQKTAALLRRVMPPGGDYERAGWSHKQVGFRW